MKYLPLLTLIALAACGAEGAPQAPAAQPAAGVTVTGEASLGVAIKG